MLILIRKLHESIILTTADGEIEIFVEDIDLWWVKIGIDAPLTVGIKRAELEGRNDRQESV